MRFRRTLTLLGVLLAWLALGPWVLAAVVVALAVPRSRRWLAERLRPTWRGSGVAAGVVLALAGLVLVLPDGVLPIPPGPGAMVTPSYVGRPAFARPIRLDVPQHPGLAPNGVSSAHGDAWATDTSRWPGPLGESPEVDTAWFGVQDCASLAFDHHGRLVALCRDRRGPSLHVLDPATMRPLATTELPAPTSGAAPPCGESAFYLDADDRAVLATADRQVLVVDTDDARGHADLTIHDTHDLSGRVPADDCVVALMPDWAGRIWFATRAGRVGAVAPGTGHVGVLDLHEGIGTALAVDRDGVYAVTDEALYRLGVDAAQRPRVTWRSPYDPGSRRKSGQLARGSGTTPTLLPDGLVAIADNATPRMHVAFFRRAGGEPVCEAAVFGNDEGATQGSLAAVGGGVVVANTHGYDGPLSTVLGRTTDAGLARVDVRDGACEVAWTSTEAAPTSVPKVSLAAGLVYAYTKRHSWWGADAWYLSALDARTGRTVFSVRTGLGPLLDNHHAPVTLARDGSAYVGTLGGLVRVRDRGQG